VLLAHQHLVLVLHLLVARPRRDGLAVELGERHRAGRDHAEPEWPGDTLQGCAQPSQVPAQLVERAAHRRVRLDEGALQLGRELGPVELREQRIDLGRGVPALQVDDVELLLDAQQGEIAHRHRR
jgi:hypothetical protein